MTAISQKGSRGLLDWIALAFGAIGLALLPWALWLSTSLQPHHRTERWDLAWSGYDAALAACFVATAIAVWRRARVAGTFAAATGVLLLVDAWFDVILESHGIEETRAVLEAVFAEIPMAVLAFWVARLHLAPAREGAAERDLVRVLEVAADGKPAGEARDADASA